MNLRTRLTSDGVVSLRVDTPQKTRTPWPNRLASPTPDPAPEGGEVLSAGRARGPVAKRRNPPQALERSRVAAPVKGSLRRAAPALDRPLNALSLLATVLRPVPAHRCHALRWAAPSTPTPHRGRVIPRRPPSPAAPSGGRLWSTLRFAPARRQALHRRRLGFRGFLRASAPAVRYCVTLTRR